MTARIPEQDDAGLVPGGRSPGGERAPESRQIRRRLTFGDARELAERPAGKVGASPWQRADEAWRNAGVDWPGAGEPAADGAATGPGAPHEGAARARKTGSIKDAAAPAPESAPALESAPAPDSEPEQPKATSEQPEAASEQETETEPRPVREPDPVPAGVPRPDAQHLPVPRRKVAAIGAAAVLVVGVGAYVVVSGDGGDGRRALPAAVVAERLFAADPAAKSDGLVQELSAVARSGPTIVAAGSETAGDGGAGRERAQFLTSADGGRTWGLARVRTADGAEPAPGDRPRLLAGGTGSWVALGQAAASGGTAVWTSEDARTWTRQPGQAPFGPRDRVNGLVRTAGGYVAAGVTLPNGRGDGRAVLWSSADGRAWQRADGLGATDITGLDRIVSAGDILVAHGTFARSVTKKKGKKNVKSTVRGEGLWRSADGGRTWGAVNVPQAQGSYGPALGLVAGPGGFYTVREGRLTTGKKKKRKTQRFGVVFGSADGQAWARQGQFAVPGYAGVVRLGASQAGLAVLVRGAAGAQSALLSADGRTWRPGGPVNGPATNGPAANGPAASAAVVSGMTVADGGALVLAGRRGSDAFLTGADLARIPGAARVQRAVDSLAAGAGRVVAVGGTGGAPAAWSAPAARPGEWTRGRMPAAQGRQRLSDVTYGPRGWLAVGRVEGTAAQPLVMISADGASWRKAPFPAGQVPSGAVAGPAGYVAVGAAGPTAATWRSADLGRWQRGAGAGRDDLGAGTRMADVAATSIGYVAVGGRRDGAAIWTSVDGLKWASVAPPRGLGPGPLRQVVAHDDLLVAVGSAPAVAVSADGGRTWRVPALTGAAGPVAVTGVSATAKGFVVAGTTGAPGRQDVVLWASEDGNAWRPVPGRGAGPHGTGLDGPGGQRFTALTGVGGDILAAGVSADHRGDTPTLWRIPAP